MYKGNAGEAGDLGHTTIDIFGGKCTCGDYGCVETLVSTRKVEENVKKELKLDNKEHFYFYDEVNIDQIVFNKIVQSYRLGSVIAKQELELAGKYWKFLLQI